MYVYVDRVCVPIDPEKCDSFDPLSIPTTFQLSKELNEYGLPSTDNDRKIPGTYMYI